MLGKSLTGWNANVCGLHSAAETPIKTRRHTREVKRVRMHANGVVAQEEPALSAAGAVSISCMLTEA